MRMSLPAMVVSAALSQVVFAQPATQPACDRACLERYVDRYLEVMLANDASPSLFARDTKFTENGIRLPLGNEGLWFGMSGIGHYKFYVPDVETQQVAFIGTVIEDMRNRGADTGEGNLVALALRLKIVGGLIAEVEQLALRPEVNLFGGGGGGGGGAGDAPARRFPPVGEAVDAMGAPHPIYREVIPESKRPSREDLIETANH